MALEILPPVERKKKERRENVIAILRKALAKAEAGETEVVILVEKEAGRLPRSLDDRPRPEPQYIK